MSVKKNESSWNYLRGLANAHPAELYAPIRDWCQQRVRESEENNYLAVGLLADLTEGLGTKESKEEAVLLFRRLVQIDEIRAKSWIRRIHRATS